jgi:hypothetical protein
MSLLLITGVVLLVSIGVPTPLGWCAYRATRKRWHQVHGSICRDPYNA